MYIAPNSDIRILSGVPLDDTYDHTLWFASEQAQTNYFISKTKFQFRAQTYQRVGKNSLRVSVSADKMSDCNYIMFRNTAFTTKWFYAFITSAPEYVNNTTAEITYEIDPLQTRYFQYKLQDCFVEREHSVTDRVGDNLIPESLETGEYISDGLEFTHDSTGKRIFGDTVIVAAAPFNKLGQHESSGAYSGIYSGLHYTVFDDTPFGWAECEEFLKKAASIPGGVDSVVSLFTCPKFFVSSIGTTAPRNVKVAIKKKLDNIDGYVPKNNKLFTFPYNFLYVTNLQGDTATYPYEYFENADNCEFRIVCSFSTDPNAVLAPLYYKGSVINLDEKIGLSGWPQLCWQTDSFRAYLAQKSTGIVSTLIAGAIAGGVGGAGLAANTIVGGSLTSQTGQMGLSKMVGSELAGIGTAAIKPPQIHGNPGLSALAADKDIDYAFMHKHIRAEFARVIDDYFSMFGYACHRVKKPNFSSRPHWNFIKTKGCVLTGEIPVDESRKICHIFDKGITFWKNPSEVGNYSLDNSPI